MHHLDLEQFARDRKTVYLPPDIKDRHPEVDWPAIAAAGNVYRHEYEAVDEHQLWLTACHEFDLLRRMAASELDILA